MGTGPLSKPQAVVQGGILGEVDFSLLSPNDALVTLLGDDFHRGNDVRLVADKEYERALHSTERGGFPLRHCDGHRPNALVLVLVLL